jgi:putative ABC transport system ATP-binding protein
MPKKQRMEKALHVLDQVSLAERSHHKPNELSGGQNQRVAIARALVNDPAIILADEPTGNLDSKTSYEIMDIFGKIHSGGNTVVLVTHEEDIANHAYRIIRLKDGILESDKRRAATGVFS